MARKPREQSAKIKQALLKSAMKHFMVVGFENATVRDIAAAAGMTTGSLYHFFKNKEAILEQIIRNAFDVTMSAASAIKERETCPLTQICYELGMQLYAFNLEPKLSQLYHSAYSSIPTSLIMDDLIKSSFQSLSNNQSRANDADSFAVVAKGLMFSLAQESAYTKKLSLHQQIDVLARGLNNFVDASPNRQASVPKEVMDLIEANYESIKDIAIQTWS